MAGTYLREKAGKFEPQPSGEDAGVRGVGLPGPAAARADSTVLPEVVQLNPWRTFLDSECFGFGFAASELRSVHTLAGLPAITGSRRSSSAFLCDNCASAEAAGGDGQ